MPSSRSTASSPNDQNDHNSLDTPQVDLSRKSHLLVLSGYIVLTFLLTLPVPLRLFSEVPGGGDAWHNIWNLWWVKEALVHLHTNPFHTTLLFYPDGANLYFHTLTPTAGLIGIPLQLLGFNLLATYNIVFLLSFVLAGYGTFLLCYYLTKCQWPSFVGGIVFSFAPYHFAHFLGHMNLVFIQWIPFYILLLLRTVTESSGIRDTVAPNLPSSSRPLGLAAGAGTMLALQAYSDWLYTIFLILFTGSFIAWKLLLPSERRVLRDQGITWREGVLRLAVGTTVFLLITLPMLVPTLAEVGRGYPQQPFNQTLVYSSDAMLAFTPSEFHPIWGNTIGERITQIGPYMRMKDDSERVVFLGYTVLVLAAYTTWRLRSKPNVFFWAFAGLINWIFSLGPILQVFGQQLNSFFGLPIRLPYFFLYKLPFMDIMRTPNRFTVLIMLSLSVLVAFAFSVLLSDPRVSPHTRPALPIWRRLVVQLGLPLLIVFEFLAIPFPTAPPGWDVPIYRQVANEAEQFAILELPLRPLGDYMAYQTVHGKPIIGGLLARQPPYPLVEQTPVLTYLRDTTSLDDAIRSSVAGGSGLQVLRDLRVKYVIIHWWVLTADQKAVMEAKLGVLFGRPADYSYPANEVAVWQIGP